MNDNTYATIYDLLYSLTTIKNQELYDFVINQLFLCNDLDVDERKTLNTFISLKEETKEIPSSGALVSRDIAFSSARTITEESLEDLTNIFISNKKKMKFTSEATNIIMDVSKPGNSLKNVQERLLELIDKSEIDNIEDKELDKTYSEEYLNKMLEKEEITGINYGIDFLDDIYPGTTPGSFTIIAGYTGSMKTTLAINHTLVNLKQGKNVLYISLEVSRDDLLTNIMSLYSYLETTDPIKRDEMNKLRYKDKDKFKDIYKNLISLEGKLQIIEEGDLESYSQSTFSSLIHKINKQFVEDTGHELDLIILDHAQLLKYDSSFKNNDPYQVLNRWTDFFRKFAAREKYSVILLSQTSRGGYEYASKHGGQYLLTGLAESNELERGATCVITLFSNDELKASGQIQVQLLKNRFGPTMIEPQTVVVRPEYCNIGNGISMNPKNVDAVFSDGDVPYSPFDNQEVEDLDKLLNGI